MNRLGTIYLTQLFALVGLMGIGLSGCAASQPPQVSDIPQGMVRVCYLQPTFDDLAPEVCAEYETRAAKRWSASFGLSDLLECESQLGLQLHDWRDYVLQGTVRVCFLQPASTAWPPDPLVRDTDTPFWKELACEEYSSRVFKRLSEIRRLYSWDVTDCWIRMGDRLN